MELAVWIEDKRRQALRRVRLTGFVIATVLLLAAGWLGLRHYRLSFLPEYTVKAIRHEKNVDAFLRLKFLADAAYLAKVKYNCLLIDITGRDWIGDYVTHEIPITSLPPGDPWRKASLDAVTSIWISAYGDQPPPLGTELIQDPWGAPVIFINSERVCASNPAWCPEDSARSAGQDGLNGTSDDVTVPIPRHLYRHLAPK